jgi:hypothetical protein
MTSSLKTDPQNLPLSANFPCLSQRNSTPVETTQLLTGDALAELPHWLKPNRLTLLHCGLDARKRTACRAGSLNLDLLHPLAEFMKSNAAPGGLQPLGVPAGLAVAVDVPDKWVHCIHSRMR